MTYKGAKTAGIRLKAREELNLAVEDGYVLEAVLDRLGFRRTAVVRKRRELWSLEGASIALDEVESLGTFAEVEIIGEVGDETVEERGPRDRPVRRDHGRADHGLAPRGSCSGPARTGRRAEDSPPAPLLSFGESRHWERNDLEKSVSSLIFPARRAGSDCQQLDPDLLCGVAEVNQGAVAFRGHARVHDLHALGFGHAALLVDMGAADQVEGLHVAPDRGRAHVLAVDLVEGAHWRAMGNEDVVDRPLHGLDRA